MASGPTTPVSGISQMSSTPASASLGGGSSEDSSKLKTFLMVLKKFIGVSDLASVRFSLPAQLMEPIPNLEYWHYLDRPDAFASIGDAPDALGRLIQCLRFWMTKDLKYIKGKPCKPYNSTLGEFFRCQWTIPMSNQASTAQTPATTSPSQDVTVSYLTEQTSHHPPISAYFIDCPAKGISACGYDQLSATFTGTRIKVMAGARNKGIFITLHSHDNEEYQLTHPTAYLSGILRGSLSISVADTCVVVCKKTGLKVILTYIEEGWLGKAQNKVQGVIYKCDTNTDKKIRIKDVDDATVVGRIEGSWQDKVWFTNGPAPFDKVPENDRILLVDVNPLLPLEKTVPPMEQQLPNESRRFWAEVTDSIVSKDYSRATNAKQEIEERQRQRATDRKNNNKEWHPRFFTEAANDTGRPILSEDGRVAIEKLNKHDYVLVQSDETAA